MADRVNYQGASAALSGLDNSLQNIAVGIARQKFEQRMAERQMFLREQQAAQQGRLYDKHAALYDAQTQLATQRAKDLERRGSARNLIAQGAAALMLPTDELDAEAMAPVHLSQIAEGAFQLPASDFNPVRLAQTRALANPRMNAILAAGGAEKLFNTVGEGQYSVPEVEGFDEVAGPVKLGANQLLLGGTEGAGVRPPVLARGRTTPNPDTKTRMMNSANLILRQFMVTSEDELGAKTTKFIPPAPEDPRFDLYQSALQLQQAASRGALEELNRVGRPTAGGGRVFSVDDILGAGAEQPRSEEREGIVDQEIETPAEPKTQADFDALPEGTLFVNPKDKTIMRKKKGQTRGY